MAAMDYCMNGDYIYSGCFPLSLLLYNEPIHPRRNGSRLLLHPSPAAQHPLTYQHSGSLLLQMQQQEAGEVHVG